VLAACATSPTGRTQLNLVPESQMAEMGDQAFEELKAKVPQARDPAVTRYVECVANAITHEVAGGSPWEVRVFQSDEVNAFALPGGKIGVYTGLLKVAENEDQLATVLGHEVTHVIAKHSDARVSTELATKTGLDIAAALAGAGRSTSRAEMFGLLGVGAEYGVLRPYSRAQESEADLVGLDLMARAGFDPRESIALWKNMEKATGKGPPAFLSDHPSHEHRIEALEARLPRALALHDAAARAGKHPTCEVAKTA
jgi:predicted Zn-dependent protease